MLDQQTTAPTLVNSEIEMVNCRSAHLIKIRRRSNTPYVPKAVIMTARGAMSTSDQSSPTEIISKVMTGDHPRRVKSADSVTIQTEIIDVISIHYQFKMPATQSQNGCF
jgi:hypothetical protein